MKRLKNRFNEAFELSESHSNLDIGSKLKHKNIEGLTIELDSETTKGYRVKTTETHKPWSGTKLRTPKTKFEFYTLAELNDLFDMAK